MYKPHEKPINSNSLYAFSSAGGGGATREIRRNEEMSTRAQTFHTNQQKWARELRHSKEFASASEMSTRAETFDTNRQKWARELRHSKESTSSGEGEGNLWEDGRSKPYEKPINSNYLHAFWSAGGGAGEIRRNEEMSTRAKTFHTNQQKWARELRHSKEFASASEMSTRAKTFDTNRQKWRAS